MVAAPIDAQLEGIYVAFGANLGDRAANIERAAGRLTESEEIRITRMSTVIETPAEGGPPQPDYLNAVARVETRLRPRALLQRLLAVERDLGRQRTVRNGPRPIDLDLLLYDAVTMETPQSGERSAEGPDLILPHPRMLDRVFVLEPLLEVASASVRAWIRAHRRDR